MDGNGVEVSVSSSSSSSAHRVAYYLLTGPGFVPNSPRPDDVVVHFNIVDLGVVGYGCG